MHSLPRLIEERSRWQAREVKYRDSNPARHLLAEDALISIDDQLQDQMIRFQVMQLRAALNLEVKGLKHSRGSVYARVKSVFGYKGSKQRVLDQLDTFIKETYDVGE